MRLFFGSYAPAQVTQAVMRLQPWLKMLPAKLVELENLHFTYVFLGDVDDKLLPELEAIGERVTSEVSPPRLTLGYLELIPSSANPRVLAVHTDVDKNFTALQKNLMQELKRLALPDLSAKPPHLTLARLKGPVSRAQLAQMDFPALQCILPEFSLIESTLTPQGPRYKPLKSFKIASNASDGRFRPNVSICLLDRQNRILLIKRPGNDSHWQLPQGGIEPDEKPEAAGIRELKEETGITNVELIGVGSKTYRYQFPKANPALRGIIGQEQRPVFLRFLGRDQEINLNQREATDYQWVPLSQLVNSVFPIRRQFTQLVKDELEKILNPNH